MPFDPVLTLETAALMLIAFLVGATVGSLLRLGVLKLRQTPVVAANVVSAPTSEAAVALVAAPVIAPLAVPRDQSVPTDIPVPDFSGAMAEPPPLPELAPARKPGMATFGRDVGRHDREKPPVQTEATPVLPIAEPVRRIEPGLPEVAELLTTLATPPDGEVEASEETAITPTSDEILVASEPAPPPVALGVTAELPQLSPAEVLPTVEAPVAIKTPLVVEAPSVVAAVRAAPDLSAAEAEAAAMRAIEGSWTPGRRMPPTEPPAAPMAVTPPELAAPAPPAQAEPVDPETAARIAEVGIVPDIVVTEDEAEQPTAVEAEPLAEVPDVTPQHEEDRIVPPEASDETAPEPAPEPELQPPPYAIPPVAQDQPPGLGAPRHGMRDDLTQIVGVLPVVETTLNRLGVYHFDQLAEWSDAHASWVEAHLGIAGRVDREQWREQARELAAIASGKRPSRKKRPS